MANISKCKNCGKAVPGNSEILIDFEVNQPYRLCSSQCFNELMEKEAASDELGQEWSARCSAAIKRGEAESGRKFADAGDALISSWINKYAYDDETFIPRGQKAT